MFRLALAADYQPAVQAANGTVQSPRLRFSEACLLTKAGLSVAARLRNPHTTLHNDPVIKGTLHLVQGDYDYYHYMQDKFDDNVRGWRLDCSPGADSRAE